MLSGSVCSSHWSAGPLFKLDLVAHKEKLLPSLQFLQAWLNDSRYKQRFSEELSGQTRDRMCFFDSQYVSSAKIQARFWPQPGVNWTHYGWKLWKTWQTPGVVHIKWCLTHTVTCTSRQTEILQGMQPALASPGQQVNWEPAAAAGEL